MIVVWRVTERCNLSCKFCGFDRQLARVRRDAKPEDVLAFGAVLAEYQRQTGDNVLVSWLGGEPLVWPPLTELAVVFRKRYGLRVSTTTNGTTLAWPAVRAHVLEHYAELTISVDGVGVFHDWVRGWPGGFASLRRNVLWLVQEKRRSACGPRLRANVVLMRDNVSQFEPLCAELAGWGIEEVTFNQLGGNDRPEFYPSHRLLSEQVEWLAAEWPGMKQRLAACGLELCGTPAYLDRIRATSRGQPLPVEDCRPGQWFLFIDETGRVAPCSFTARDCGVPLAEVTSVDALRQLPAHFAQARRGERLRPCADCHSTQVFEKFSA
jgi:MoaA/NifB/PqqE/SkfB family radical SAM enzyme